MNPTARARARRRYDRWAPLLSLLLLVIGVAGILTGSFAMYVNGQQDARRDSDQSALLACFDTYASATATASQAVREAQVRKDAAAANAAVALNREGEAFLGFVRKLMAGKANGVEDIEPLEQALEARAAAGRLLEIEQDHLDKVRAANPIPEPPSVVCAQETADETESSE